MAIGLNKGESSKEKSNRTNESEDIQDLRGHDTASKSKMDLKSIIIISVVFLLVIIIGIISFSYMNKSNNNTHVDETLPTTENEGELQNNVDSNVEVSETENSTEQSEKGNGVYDEEGNVTDEEAIDPGIPDFSTSEKSHTTKKVYDADDYLKDLNGVDVAAVYNVVERNYIQDYVSYTAKRAVIDEGMELYWLEAKYDDKKYRIQVPFYYFKDLKSKGICKVEMEILTTEDGGKIISYMQVIEDDSDD